MGYKDTLARIIRDYLDSEHFEFSNIDTNTFYVDGLLKMRTCGFSFGISFDDYGIRAEYVCLIKAPAAYAANVVEYITRVNRTLKTGCFTFDYDSGSVGYLNYLPCEEGPPSISDLEYSIQYPICAIHKFQSGLANLLTGAGTPIKCFESAMQNTISYRAVFTENLSEV